MGSDTENEGEKNAFFLNKWEMFFCIQNNKRK